MLYNPEDKEILIKWGGGGCRKKMYKPDIAALQTELELHPLISIAHWSTLFGKEV